MKQNTEQLKKEFFDDWVCGSRSLIADGKHGYIDLDREGIDMLWEWIEQKLTKTTPHLISSDEIKREAVMDFVAWDAKQTEKYPELGKPVSKTWAQVFIREYLTQSKEGGE